MTPETMRDATFQRAADWFEARTGVGCFGVARRIATACALCSTGSGLILNGTAPHLRGGSTVYVAIAVSVTLLAFAAYLRTFEARPPRPALPVVIPVLRQPLFVVIGTVLAATSVPLFAGVASMTWDLVRFHGSEPGAVPTIAAASMLLVTLWYPTALLFATCRWRRRPPSFRHVTVGEEARRRGAASEAAAAVR